MTDRPNPDFTAANAARKEWVVEAILGFSWDNYRLHEVAELALEVQEELQESGESDRMKWAEDLAEVVMRAARPIDLGEASQ